MAKYSKAKAGKPGLGFDCKPSHGYLGHFKQEKHLRAGHNFSTVTVRPQFSMLGDTLVQQRRRGGVTAYGGTDAERALNTLGRSRAAADILAGGSAVAAERPVLAARLAARAQGVTGAARKEMIQAARQDPNSALSERRQRRGSATVISPTTAIRTGRGY